MPGPTAHLATALAEAHAAGIDRLDAELLAAHVLGVTRSAIIAHPDQPLATRNAENLRALYTRRAAGVPFALLVGHQAFHALELEVTAEVFVPRSDTEILVDAVLTRLPDTELRGLDLGCGCGTIALALAAARPTWHLVASDISPTACLLAQRNASRLGLANRVHMLAGHWYTPVAGECWDLIVSNPPYVADHDPDLMPEVRAHEPDLALFAGPDGLDALRTILAAPPLRPGGLIAVEHGHRQGAAVRRLMTLAGLGDITTRTDLAGHDRITLAQARLHG